MRIFQYHSGTHPRDAITNSMLLILNRLQRLGVDGGIMAEIVHPELTALVAPFDSARLEPDDILLIHHSFGNGLINEVTRAQCRKILIYHNITKPEFFRDAPALRQAAIEGYAQLWDLREVVDGAIADSNFNGRALTERGFDNVLPLCLLADFEDLPNHPHLGRPYHHFDDIFHILFVGRICANKGQHHLIRALPAVEEALGRKVRLTLCGHTDHGSRYLLNLQAEVARSGLEGRVVMAGSVSNAELYGYYREADAYVSYSQHEGFGVPLIEAMAFGTPVFAYGCTAIPETLGGAGRLLSSFRPEELATAIHEVFSKRSTWRSVIRAQRQRASDLSIQTTFPQLASFLEQAYGITLSASKTAPALSSGALPQLLFEGPFDGIYSLSQVNRNLAIAAAKSGAMSVSAIPREGVDSYVFDVTELDRTPYLVDLLESPFAFATPSVGLRNMYPPRIRGQVADLRLHLLYWEEGRLPADLVRQINEHLDGLLAPTRYCAKVFRDSGVKVPIRVIGQGMVNPEVGKSSRLQQPRRRPYVFLHVSSGLPRKGVEELLKAYVSTFTAADDVVLLIKTYQNPSNVLPRLLADFATSGASPQIILDDSKMSDTQIAELYDIADAVVLPTRGEGFNLPAAEALKSGRLLLVTGTGAHMDFCTEQNAVLLKSRFEPSQSHLTEKASYWAQVDVEDLSRHMRDAFEGQITKTSEFNYAMEDWNIVFDNIATFVADLESERPVKEKIRIVSISTFNTRCGIAEYTTTLLNEFPAPLYDIEHWATIETPEAAHLESANVRRFWKHLDGGFAAMCQRAVEQNFETVLVQFNFGFFEIIDFFQGIAMLDNAEIPIFVIFHKTADAEVLGRTVSLRHHVAGLAKITRIFVHDIADLNFLAGIGIHENVILLPHFIYNLPDLSKTGLRRAFGLPTNASVVATNGFLLPNKGIPSLIEAFALLRGRLENTHLILSTAIFPAPQSEELAQICQNLISIYRLQGQVTLITDFLTKEQIHMLLSAADLIVYPYGFSRESVSGSVRQGLAARRPVLGTTSPILASVLSAIDTVEVVEPKILADAMESILSDSEKQVAMTKRVAEFICNQTPYDIATIITANINQELVARQNVEIANLPPLTKASKASQRVRPVLGRNSRQDLLQGLLGRAPTPEQVTAFAAPGSTVLEAVNELLCSNEYYDEIRLNPQKLEALRLPVIDIDALCARDGADFLDACYDYILNRKSDDVGFTHFMGLLKSDGKDPIIQKRWIINAMLASDEYKSLVVPRIIIGRQV